MYALTNELIHEHQHTLLEEATRARRGDRLARSTRLHRRAANARRRARRANAHVS